MKMTSFCIALSTRHEVKYHRSLVEKAEKLSSVDSEFEGRVIKASQYVMDDPCTRFIGLKPSDFALENTLALGVPMSMCKCSLQTNEVDYALCEKFSKMSNLKPVENE